MAEHENKQHVISLLTMPKKKMSMLEEDELTTVIQEVEAVKLDSVKDGRFLGNLKRRRQC